MFSSTLKATISILLFTALPAVQAVIHEVIVGGPGKLKFDPENLDATIGDVVRFTFQQKNHSVTQSTLGSPCSPLSLGFDSGFVPVADDVTSGFQTAEYNVTSTDPVWAYCKQGTHCSAAGMVFAINPGNQMAAFKAAATGSAAPPSSTASAPTTSSTSTAVPQQIKIVVGGTNVIAFNPPNIQAKVGDTIVFEFHQKNHSVVASSFDAPCVPLAQSVAGENGFNSGFFPVAADATTFPTYSVQVNDTKPIWAYCGQTSHCGQGMVFSANAIETGAKSFAAFQALAKSLNGSTTPTYGSPSGASSTAFNSASVVIVAFLSVALLI
jgi:plastocyanin